MSLKNSSQLLFISWNSWVGVSQLLKDCKDEIWEGVMSPSSQRLLYKDYSSRSLRPPMSPHMSSEHLVSLRKSAECIGTITLPARSTQADEALKIGGLFTNGSVLTRVWGTGSQHCLTVLAWKENDSL